MSKRTDHQLYAVWALLVWALFTVSAAEPVSAMSKSGFAVDGGDTARMLPPAGAVVESYSNAGYQLIQEGGEARVSVAVAPLESRSSFEPPTLTSEGDPVARLARTLSLGATTEYEAISRVLSWVARNIEYRLDRSESQESKVVLERRTGYCTGIARLTVALLSSIGIEAREVAGFVYSDGVEGPQGFHRWIEARLSDVGWVYSDPLFSHHYVPASYLRLASERIEPARGIEGVLIERRDEIAAVDLSLNAGPGIRIRRNNDRRLAAALQISVESGGAGLAVLESKSRRFRHLLVGGATTFLGLEPGQYHLRVMLTGHDVVERRIEVVGRQRTTITLAASMPSERTAPSDVDATVGGLE